ncbi:hypothetical protein ACOI1H_04460 [Loktanella sp. DJP18]|uniref:hypothetical protein n=1 Tax=Loktanella sp. DJP18 TaxID=3409788 RepID=UPI003BB7F2D7
MKKIDQRCEHLGWAEVALQTANPDLPALQISAQAHYGSSDCVAFVDVYGVDHDRIRRRQIRSEASDLLRQLGYRVEIEPGRDICDLEPIRPGSAHDRIHMLKLLRSVCGQNT